MDELFKNHVNSKKPDPKSHIFYEINKLYEMYKYSVYMKYRKQVNTTDGKWWQRTDRMIKSEGGDGDEGLMLNFSTSWFVNI